MTVAPQPAFWRSRRVLLTGHTGFKGSWLTLALERLGAEVTGIGLPPLTTPNLFTEAGIGQLCRSHFLDIRDAAGLAGIVRAARPEIVFHLAAQPLVRESYRDPLTTFETNVMGTAHVLEALRGVDAVRVAVMVTTDKVYRTAQMPGSHREDDPLGGHDPYSASKAASEMVIESYRRSYLSAQPVAVASARAGNVIGGGDWSQDRLIPDAVRAWHAGRPLHVRRPLAKCIGERQENAMDFLRFLLLECNDFVIDLHGLQRLEKDTGARCRDPVDDAWDGRAVFGSHDKDIAAVTVGDNLLLQVLGGIAAAQK